MREKWRLGRNRVILLSIIGLSVIFVTVAFQSKEGMFMDEFLTYLLANTQVYTSGEGIAGISGIKHIPQDFYVSRLASTGFDLKNVWTSQAADVHPPLYYMFIHILSSFWKGIFTVRPGFLVNILCHLINILLVYKISRLLIDQTEVALMCSALFGFSATVIDSAIFIRMYVMLTSWALLFIYWHLKYWEKRRSIYFYTSVMLTSVGGC